MRLPRSSHPCTHTGLSVAAGPSCRRWPSRPSVARRRTRRPPPPPTPPASPARGRRRGRLCHLSWRQGRRQPGRRFSAFGGPGFGLSVRAAHRPGQRLARQPGHGARCERAERRAAPGPGRVLRRPIRPFDADRLAATHLGEPAKADTGAWLAVRGAWDRNVPACNQCHGPGGIGVGTAFRRWPASRPPTSPASCAHGARASDRPARWP